MTITPPEAGPEFAAGVATATAAQAAEEAAEAEAVAEGATEVAEAALEVAGAAEEAAWDARIAIDDLRSEMLSRFDELAARTAVAEAVAVEAVEAIEEGTADDTEDDTITPPEQQDSPSKPTPTEDPSGSSGAPKKKAVQHTGYGARWIQPRG